ncbi:MAG: HYR domain-containing protein, partial [Acidobacteriota bacterium]
KDSFNLGETVCAKASGVPVTVFPWRVLLIDPAGFVRDSQTAIADDQATYQFTLPSSPQTTINGQTVDNRGTWRVNLVRSNGAIRQSAPFTVHQTSNPVADVFVQKLARNGDATVSVGGSIAFLLVVANAGPDSAQSVHLIDSTPSGSTLVSFTQQSGPACAPASSGNCTIATLAGGDRAEFTAVYQIGGSPGTVSTSATVSSTTADSNSDNNTSTAEFEVAPGGTASQCSLICPTPITYTEDSPGAGGRTVASSAFPAPVTTGTCGSVSSTAVPNPQTNNYFFPVGISVITISTESGEECTFTVTVTDDQNPTITCPGNISKFEDTPGSGFATVNFNVTASDNSGNVDITCTHASGDSFPVGTTNVICTATDGSNNTATCNFDVIVTGVNSTCVLTTQAPIVVDSPANACGANVTFATPTSSSGTCGTITCDHASGSFFPAGETVVTCTSSPDGANTSFTVTVNDVTPPVPTLSSLPTLTETCSVTAGVPTTIITPTGPKVVIEPPTATDNCGGLISASTQDERTYDSGTHVVTWTYTDAAGNRGSAVATIVQDP